MSKEASEEVLDMQRVMSLIRAFAKRMIERDVSPSDMSFALAYVGAELGMLTSRDPAQSLPVVLNGLSQAATNFSEAKRAKGTSDEELEAPPSGVSIH